MIKPFLILLSFIFFSCSGKQEEKIMETEIIESYFTNQKFKNTKENFDKINMDLLGIRPDKLQKEGRLWPPFFFVSGFYGRKEVPDATRTVALRC